MGVYRMNITLKPENEKRLIEYFEKRQVKELKIKKEWALNCESHQDKELNQNG